MPSERLDDTEDVFEWVCAWWMLRTDETEDDVDLRPRKPADERRYEPLGVIGDGDNEFRFRFVFSGRGWRGNEWRLLGYEALLRATLLVLDARLTCVGVASSPDWPPSDGGSDFFLGSWPFAGLSLSGRNLREPPGPPAFLLP